MWSWRTRHSISGEFFRVWTVISSTTTSHASYCTGGRFRPRKRCLELLNLITKDDPDSHYPYANEEYRNLFRHALWMVPGVKEAKALSKLMKKHPVFGCGAFDIVNVAGDGDEEERSEDALQKVRQAINGAVPDGLHHHPFLRQADHRRHSAGVDGCVYAGRIVLHFCRQLSANHLPGTVALQQRRQD